MSRFHCPPKGHNRIIRENKNLDSPCVAVIDDTDLVLVVETYYEPEFKLTWKQVIFRDMVGWVAGELMEYKHNE